jgi:hypothetical protein
MLTLEELLPIVQKKYPEAKIFEDYIEIRQPEETGGYLYLIEISKDFKIQVKQKDIDNTIYYEFDNIIELKHYLDIEIDWEDLVELVKIIKNKDKENDWDIVIDNNHFIIGLLWFEKENKISCGNYMKEYNFKNHSYWQMYNVIKNLTE